MYCTCNCNTLNRVKRLVGFFGSQSKHRMCKPMNLTRNAIDESNPKEQYPLNFICCNSVEFSEYILILQSIKVINSGETFKKINFKSSFLTISSLIVFSVEFFGSQSKHRMCENRGGLTMYIL